MDNNMSAAAFIHRPGGGSSSASSTGTGSSAGGGPGNGGSGGGRVAVIGVTRNVRLRRRGASGFGFSLRGGREYAAGFYVSDVQPGGEADRNGLRVGDQIIRVNGYPVEDAVHQEVALLAKNQQVLVLKIRSVGMIPVKDNPNDPVTWHMVQQHHHQQQQQQQQQHQQQHPLRSNEAGEPTIPYNEIRIRVMVGEKGKLGCGVCRGIVPGLTVQGTRENGPARAAGLKGGDVIIWCNGQQLTDMPFDRAIEVMRSAAILDLIVNRPIPASNGIYDCPETLWMRGSSGYDSESSSLLTTSPTPPVNHNPPSPQHHINAQNRYPRNDVCGNRNGRACCPLALSTSSSSSEWSHSSDQNTEWTRRLNNTTVIRVNHNATQNHLNLNQYRSNTVDYPGHPACRENYGMHPESRNEPLYDPVTPRDYESHDFDANPHDERNGKITYDKNPTNYDLSVDERISYTVKDTLSNTNAMQRHGDVERKSITTVDVHQSSGPPAPPCPPPSYKWQSDAKPMISMGKQMGSTMSMGSTGSTETESSLESCGKDSASTSSSLSTSSCEPVSTIASTATTTNVPPTRSPEISVALHIPPPPGRPCPPISSTDLSSAITQELQRRAQQRSLNARKLDGNKEKPTILDPKKPANSEALRVQENKVTHDKLMEEFKRAHQKMFNGHQQEDQLSSEISEKEQPRRIFNGTSTEGGPPPPPMPLPVSIGREDAVEMQSIESFKLKESPSSVIPKPPPTYFSSSNTSPTSTPSNGSPRHSATLTKVHLNGNPKDTVNNQMEKMAPKVTNGSTPCTGKVAVRIGAYEGETKQPSRLDFLPSQPRTVTDSSSPTNGLVSTSPVVSRLQNELAATLQRSNLKKKTDSEIVALQSPTTLTQGNVEKLATALSNKVTIKVSPENGQH